MSTTTSKTEALKLFLEALSRYDQAAANYHLDPTDETWKARGQARDELTKQFERAIVL